MPLKSKAQHRFLRAAEAEGKVPPGTASRWWHHTSKKDRKKLPERVSDKTSAYQNGVKTALEKLAVSQRQTARINAALEKMHPSTGAGPLDAIERSANIANQNYGPGWRDLSGISGTPTQKQLSDVFSLEKGLLSTPNEMAIHNTDRQMMSPAERLKAHKRLGITGAAAPFRPNPSSPVPWDVQRGEFLRKAKLKRFSYEPDRITKIRAALPLDARPVLAPTDPPRGGINLTKTAPALGPADAPFQRLWRGSDKTLRPEDLGDPTWTSGHFGVAEMYAERLGDRVTAYRSKDIPTGHFTPHVQTDTRGWSPARAAQSRAANPEWQFHERVVNSSDLDPSRIESQYVRGTEGLYHKRGKNFFPTTSATPYGYPQYRPQAWYTKLLNGAKRLAGKVPQVLKRFHWRGF